MTLAAINRILLTGMGLLLCAATASAYNYHLDRDIQSLKSRGTALVNRYQSAREQMSELHHQQQVLDRAKRQLASDQASFDKSARAHQQQVAEQNQTINDVKNRCNNSNTAENTSGHVNHCDNTIAAVNAKSGKIRSDAEALQKQQSALDANALALNRQVAHWNRDQMLAISVFNDASTRLNNWLNDAYAFMNTRDFQDNIAWAHASKRCEDNGTVGAGTSEEQALYSQAEHALGCLSDVENARMRYYKSAK